MPRVTGTYARSTTLGETVQAFVPHPLPPGNPALSTDSFRSLNHQAALALARLAGVAGLVPSVEWLLYSAIRKEALLTSQIEGTQATLIDLFDDEAGLRVSNTDDVEEVANYLRAFRWTQGQLRNPTGLPITAKRIDGCWMARAERANSPARSAARRTGSAARGRATRPSCRHLRNRSRHCCPIWSVTSMPRAATCRLWSGSR